MPTRKWASLLMPYSNLVKYTQIWEFNLHKMCKNVHYNIFIWVQSTVRFFCESHSECNESCTRTPQCSRKLPSATTAEMYRSCARRAKKLSFIALTHSLELMETSIYLTQWETNDAIFHQELPVQDSH